VFDCVYSTRNSLPLNRHSFCTVQEPYNYLNQVKGIPRNYKLFTSGKARKRAAVLIVNKKIDANLLDQLSDEDTAMV